MDIKNKHSIFRIESGCNKRINYFYVKRFFDVIFAVLGIILLIIPFLIVAIIIKLDDFEGNVYFKQERVGKNGELFYIYKFRSMYSDAESRLEQLLIHNEIDGAMFKMQNDPRITPIGKFIRKYSIDELPQIINVLKGDMSFIGPRPPLPREVIEYTTTDKKRLAVCPGITGLWQVSGRNSLSFHEMVQLDLHYIDTLSFSNDFKIAIKTPSVIIKSSHAY